MDRMVLSQGGRRRWLAAPLLLIFGGAMAAMGVYGSFAFSGTDLCGTMTLVGLGSLLIFMAVVVFRAGLVLDGSTLRLTTIRTAVYDAKEFTGFRRFESVTLVKGVIPIRNVSFDLEGPKRVTLATFERPDDIEAWLLQWMPRREDKPGESSAPAAASATAPKKPRA